MELFQWGEVGVKMAEMVSRLLMSCVENAMMLGMQRFF